MFLNYRVLFQEAKRGDAVQLCQVDRCSANNLLQVELQENSYAELIMENEKDKKNGTGPLLSVCILS